MAKQIMNIRAYPPDFSIKKGFLHFLLWKILILVGIFATFSCRSLDENKEKPPNVLLIILDDLRPALGCYGDKAAITPNIDQLAAGGILFNNAYCQQALCVPSRASFLTGQRPDDTQVYGFYSFRKALPEVVTLPAYFKQNGYYTLSFGKVFDNHNARGMDPGSWSEPERFPVSNKADQYVLPKNKTGKKATAIERAEGPDEMYMDGEITNEVINTLSALPAQPFFIAVGYRKPHLPFSAPEKYWQMYDTVQFEPAIQEAGKNCPAIALHDSRELRGYLDIPGEREISRNKARELTQGYYACISYVDALIGKIRKALQAEKLEENTIIVFTSDHGFHLGEHSLWCKTSNFELDARVPLIMSIPGNSARGKATDNITELIDLYPTLAELCGLELPSHLPGQSLLSVLQNPHSTVKEFAFTQHPRPSYDTVEVMGYSIRTRQYRYTEWREWQNEKIIARELYDHSTDEQEMENIVDELGQEKLVEDLSLKIQENFTSIHSNKL
jgi:iduronate 2-sulfatase